MRIRLTALCLLGLWVAVAGAGITIKGETRVEQYKLVRLEVAGASDGAAVVWDIDEEKLDVDESGTKLVMTGPPGTYRIKVRAIVLKDGKATIDTARATVTITGKAPQPGPTPDPGPTPGPAPDPSPAPIPAEGLRVLVVYEAGEDAKLSKGQLATIYGKAFRTLMDQKCVTGADGKTREWRIYDKDTDTGGEAKHWQDAMKRPRTQVPWLVISNGKTGYEGPLPEGAAETLALINKYER